MSVGLLALICSCGSSGGTTGDGDGDGGNGGKRDNDNNGGTPVEQEVFVNSDSQAGISRLQTVSVSVPFSRGQAKPKDLEKMGVEGRKTSWRVLQSWGDGSVRVAQAQFADAFEGSKSKRYKVVKDTTAALDDFVPHPWVKKQYGKYTVTPEVVDDDGISYYGLVTGEGQLLHSSRFSRTRFWRIYLYNLNPNAGIKRDFLAARVYMTEYADMPFIATDITVGSDYLGADDPKGSKDKNLYALGPVSFKAVKLHATSPWTEIRMRERHGIKPGVWNAQGGHRTFVAMENTHLDDGQTKLWSLLSYIEDAAGSQVDRDAWKLTWEEEVARPLRPMANREAWQKSGAAGINGGPTTGPANSYDLAEKEWNSWKGGNHFGPVGDWGDNKWSATTGTPRNSPLGPEIAKAIQGENPHMLEVLEGMASQQAMRQYHVWGLRVKPEDDLYLWFGLWFGIVGDKKLSGETLGRYQILRNDGAYDPYKNWRRNVPGSSAGHGWNAFDAEHATSDIVFDYYTMTGSFWARDELAMLGEWTKGVLRVSKYNSSGVQSARAEGWCMQTWVQCWLATGDDSIKTYALNRIEQSVEKGRNKTHPSRAMSFQFNYPGTGYPNDTGFYMPWQHAAVMYGYLAVHRFWGSETALRIAEDAVRMVDYASVENFTNPLTKKVVPFEVRYYAPAIFNGTYKNQPYKDYITPPNFFDDHAESGPHLGVASIFLVSGLYLTADRTKDNALRARALYLGDKILGAVGPERTNFVNKWASVIPDHLVPGIRK